MVNHLIEKISQLRSILLIDYFEPQQTGMAV